MSRTSPQDPNDPQPAADYLLPHVQQLAAYVPGQQPRRGELVKLNTNENPYPSPPAAIAAIQETAANGLHRYPDPMANSFRQAAAQLFNLPGPDWVLAGNGSDEILTMLVRGFLAPGQSLRLPYPSYILYRTLADIQDANWQQVPFDVSADGTDWQLPSAFGIIDPDDAQDVRLVVLPNPNSPSGTLVSVEHVARIAASLNCPLVVDEAYVDFAPTSCVSLVHEMPNVIVTRTLSKSYGLAGLRFGFALANPETIAGLSKIKDSYNCDALSIAAATAAINSQSWLRENVAKILKTRYRMFHQLSEMGFRVTPSHANFLWCTHPSGRHEELYAGLRNAGWLVRWMRFPDWGDGLRISVGTDEQIDACFDVLRSLVEGLDQ